MPSGLVSVPASTYLFLVAAIVAEVIATSALARTENFTRLAPSVITVVGYAFSFWCLSYPIRVLPTGIVYAIWSGAGIVLITMVAWLMFDQKLDVPALLGLALIIAGVVVINVFSKSVGH
ncbi:MAG: SMR family transporter [Roseibium sp.]